MRQRLGTLLAWAWIAAGVAVFVSASINLGSQQTTPLWWWILAAVVVGLGLVVFGSGRRARAREESTLRWWRGLPLGLRPFGIWATFNYVVFSGVVLPGLGIMFLVEGDVAGRLVGAGLLLLSLLGLWDVFRRRRPPDLG